MRIGVLFGVFVYTILAVFVGLIFIGIGVGSIPYELVVFLIDALYENPQYLYIVLGIGIGLIVFSYLCFRWTFGTSVRRKEILFKGPDGEIQISLASPVDAIVKEVSSQIKEIVDVRQESYMLGKTLVIQIRVVMGAQVKIKEISEKIQNMVIERIKDYIGYTDPIKVKVKVVRVQSTRKKTVSEDKEEDIPIPFRNMDV